MKTQLRRFSKSTLAVVLTLCMLMSCLTVGLIATDAAAVPDGNATSANASSETVGASDYRIYYNTGSNSNPSTFKDAGVDVTVSGSEFTAVFPSTFFTQTNTNYYIALCYQNAGDIFFKGGSAIKVYTDGDCFSANARQEYGSDQFARISVNRAPGTVKLTVDTDDRSYLFETVTTTSYNVTVTAGAGGSVKAGNTSIAAGKSSLVSVAQNGSIGLSAEPNDGYRFTGWTVSGSGATVASASSASTTLKATASGATVTAKFAASSTTTKRIYFDNTNYNYDPPYAYAWSDDGTKYLEAWPGTKMKNLTGNIWYIDVSTDAQHIQFNGQSSSSQTPNLDIPTNDNDYFKNGVWTKYQKASTSNHFTASLGNTIQSNDSLYTAIDATFYDYYTSNEYNGSWYTSIQPKSDAWIGGISNRHPYDQLNQSLSEYAQKNSITYPMYFFAAYWDNNYHGSDSGYSFYNSSWAAGGGYVNDSNNLGGNNKALTGLSGKTIKNDAIYHYKSGATNENGAEMVLFNEDWLTSRTGYTYNNALATIIDSNFPVRQTTREVTEGGPQYVYLKPGSNWQEANAWYAAVFRPSSSDDTHTWAYTKYDSSTGYYYVEIPSGLTQIDFVRMNAGDRTTLSWDNKWNDTGFISIPTTYEMLVTTTGWDNAKTTSNYKNTGAGTKKSQTYYEFDSTGGKDNIYFDNLTSKPVMQYAYNQRSVKNGYNSGDSFLPFDRWDSSYYISENNWTATGYGKDLGFGMKLKIKFTLGSGGKIDGMDQVFNFSGDDDLWVFVDDQLVLDLGGNHAMTTGSINFATKKATADNSVTIGSLTSKTVASRNTTFTIDNNNTNKVHTMTLYYMERGMHESNLKFGFSFTPVGNEFVAEDQTSFANVNAGLLSAVKTAAANDSFTITHKNNGNVNSTGGTYRASSNKSYIHTNANGTETSKSTGTTGTYELKSGETADFVDKFDEGESFDITVASNPSNRFNYTSTLVSVTDTETQGRRDITAPSGSNGYRFRFLSTALTGPDDLTLTSLYALIRNTLVTRNVTITKRIPGTTDSTNTFTFKVEVDLGDGSGYKTYALDYTLNGEEATMNASTGLISGIHRSDTIYISGIPEKASVRVTETTMPNLYYYDTTSVTANDSDGASQNMFNQTTLEGTPVASAATNGAVVTLSTKFSGYTVTITNRPYKYKIVYNYLSRILVDDQDITKRPYGDQSYTVSGNITQTSSLSGSGSSARLTQAVVQRFTPYESNFKENLTWNYATTKYGYDAATHTYTAEITATPSGEFEPTIEFILPYAYTKKVTNGTTLLVANNNTYTTSPKAILDKDNGVKYFDRFYATVDGQEVYINAPKTIVKGGNEYNFVYWSIRAKNHGNDDVLTGDWEEIARCYTTDYNYVTFDHYQVQPMYECDNVSGSWDSDIMANISLLGYSRNQWNEDGKGDKNTAKNAMDTVFVDFNLSFMNKGEVILPTSGTKVGVILENCGNLTYNEATGEYITDYSKYSKAETSANVKKFISGDLTKDQFKSATGMTNISKFEISDQQLTNKNRLQYYVGVNASENGSELNNKYSLYRAYSYMIDSAGNVTLSKPVFFQIYEYATKTL